MLSLNSNLFYPAFIIIFSNFLGFFFDDRGCSQAAKGGNLSRGKVPRGGFLGVVTLPKFKNLCKFKDQNLQIYGTS